MLPEESDFSPDGAQASSVANPPPAPTPGPVISQELVEKLADKVFTLLLNDLRTEAERSRLSARWRAGGRSHYRSEGGW